MRGPSEALCVRLCFVSHAVIATDMVIGFRYLEEGGITSPSRHRDRNVRVHERFVARWNGGVLRAAGVLRSRVSGGNANHQENGND